MAALLPNGGDNPTQNATNRNSTPQKAKKTRIKLNSDERVYLHQQMHETQFWRYKKMQQTERFASLIAKVKSDVNAPFRARMREGVGVTYIQTLVKNMPRYITEKNKRFKGKRKVLEDVHGTLSDEDFRCKLTAADETEYTVLQLSTLIVQGLQDSITSSDSTVTEAQNAAEQARQSRIAKRQSSQREYADRKKARKKEAEAENRVRLTEHRTEKLLTASVNDARQTSGILSGMVRIFGMQSGLSTQQIEEALGPASVPGALLPSPPTPELIVISDSEDDENESCDGGEIGSGADQTGQDEEDSED